MGLYRQPNDYSCGPFALKHALVTLGKLADEEAISAVAHPHWWAGTDEVKLARAARHFGCDLPLVRRTSEDRAFGVLDRYIERKLPVILCVDDWGHWITVVRQEQNRYVVLDSKDAPVMQVLSRGQLKKRWNYREENENPDLFDLHPVMPRFRVSVKAQFSVERAQYLRRPSNADLAKHWDAYLEDLLEICHPRSGRTAGALSMGEFLRRHQELLVSRLLYWHGDIEKEAAVRLLRNFRFVAETYALVIPLSSTRRALADLAMLLAMWAASGRGIGEMYGAEGTY